MNAEQIQSLIRKFGSAVGPILMIIGLVPTDKWQAFVDAVYNAVGPVSAALGAAASVGSIIWGVLSHTSSAKIAAVNNTVPGVKVVPNSAPAAPVTKAP